MCIYEDRHRHDSTRCYDNDTWNKITTTTQILAILDFKNTRNTGYNSRHNCSMGNISEKKSIYPGILRLELRNLFSSIYQITWNYGNQTWMASFVYWINFFFCHLDMLLSIILCYLSLSIIRLISIIWNKAFVWNKIYFVCNLISNKTFQIITPIHKIS